MKKAMEMTPGRPRRTSDIVLVYFKAAAHQRWTEIFHADRTRSF